MENNPIEDIDAALERIKLQLAKHRCGVKSCVNEQEIAAFENQHAIRLPVGYRRFLREIGNGGYGPPACGLLEFGKFPDNYVVQREETLRNLHKPFPLEEFWVWENDHDENVALHQAVNCGNLPLGDDGCGQYWLLIVTGPQRGQIWLRTDVGITPCAPGRTFLSWYEYWLAGGRDWWAADAHR